MNCASLLYKLMFIQNQKEDITPLSEGILGLKFN